MSPVVVLYRPSNSAGHGLCFSSDSRQLMPRTTELRPKQCSYELGDRDLSYRLNSYSRRETLDSQISEFPHEPVSIAEVTSPGIIIRVLMLWKWRPEKRFLAGPRRLDRHKTDR